MIDRRALGDVGLAVLLALPTATLARTSGTATDERPALAATSDVQLAAAERSPLQSRFSLPG